MLQRYETERGTSLRLETAADGAELLALWRPGRWDLIFLDIYMPQLSGVEAARRLREVDRRCEIVFAATSREHGMVGHELHAMEKRVFRMDDGGSVPISAANLAHSKQALSAWQAKT